MKSVTEKIGTQIASLSPVVEDAVVKALVDRELLKRTEAIVQVMDLLLKLENDLKKLKPDSVFYDADGKEVDALYSKSKAEEKKKLLERIGKVTNALTRALEKGDMKDVYDLKNQGQGGKGNQPATDTDSDKSGD